MTILFAGGEVEDFVIVGAVVASAASSPSVRSAYARASVAPTGAAWGTNFFRAPFTASSACALTFRIYLPGAISAGQPFVWFSTGGSARLRLRTVSTSPTTLILESYTSGGVATTLATTTSTILISTAYRFDLLISYGASGRARLYIDGVLVLDTGTMDITVSGATTLDSVSIGSVRTSGVGPEYSEIIVTDGEDSRPLSLKTLAPNGAGDTSAWTGAYTDIDETTASDVDVMSSGTAGQVTNMECTGMPSGGSGLSVRAVKVVASALRGASGPQKMQLGVKSGSTEGWSADKTLDTGYGTVSDTWTTNPATGAAFTSTELDALKLAVKSIA